jgi:hypothetical protein
VSLTLEQVASCLRPVPPGPPSPPSLVFTDLGQHVHDDRGDGMTLCGCRIAGRVPPAARIPAPTCHSCREAGDWPLHV